MRFLLLRATSTIKMDISHKSKSQSTRIYNIKYILIWNHKICFCFKFRWQTVLRRFYSWRGGRKYTLTVDPEVITLASSLDTFDKLLTLGSLQSFDQSVDGGIFLLSLPPFVQHIVGHLLDLANKVWLPSHQIWKLNLKSVTLPTNT